MEWDPSGSMLIPGALSQCPCPAYWLPSNDGHVLSPAVSSTQTVIPLLERLWQKDSSKAAWQKPCVCERVLSRAVLSPWVPGSSWWLWVFCSTRGL